MLIEFSQINLKILILLIFPVFKRIQDYTKKSYLQDDNQLFKNFRYFFSYIFSFVPLLIVKYRSKNSVDLNTKSNQESKKIAVSSGSMCSVNEINELQKVNFKKRKIKNILYLAILCLSGLVCYFYRYFLEKTEFTIAKQSIGVFCEIAIYIGLSYFLLNQKLYKHHFIFSGIIALVVLILFIISFFYMERGYILLSFPYYMGFSFCFGFYDIFGKKYMLKFFISPYFMMFMIGIIDTILLLIYDLFAYNINPDISGIIFGFKNNVNTTGKVFLFILDIIIQNIWNEGIWLTVYYFTPCHYFVSEYISEYVYYMKTAVEKNEGFYSTVNIIIFSVSYLINFICILFFNEILILNLFGLDYNTKKRIEHRLQKENFENTQATKLLEMDPELNDEEDSESNI